MTNFDVSKDKSIDLRDGKGVQVGDGNTQYNTFNEIITISVDVIKTRTFNSASPYKGLKKFEPKAADSKRFFGRDQLIYSLMQELDKTNLLLLLGASGSGKSSVIQAGLIPRFEEKYASNLSYFIFKPDKNPFQSLFNAFSGQYGQEKTEIIQQEKENILIELVKNLKEKDNFWLIYIDQFEEIFHLSAQEQGKKFIKALVKLYKYLKSSQDFSVKLMMTMRTDFLDKFSAYPELKYITITQKNIEMIADMKPDELRQAIEQPAAQNGVVFEDGLVKEIMNDVKDQPGYLPLLQYTLDLLWQKDNVAEDRELNIITYRNLGGVRGALQQHVDKIYESLSDEKKEATRIIFLKLVKVKSNQESGTLQKAVSQRAKRSEFQGEFIQGTLTELINNNLIVSQGNIEEKAKDAEGTVEIAHEILLSSWDTLRKWIEDAYQVISIRDDLVKSLYRWQETKKDEDFLAGSLLAEAREKRDNKTFDLVLGEKLTPEQNQFIDQSYAHAERQRNAKVRTARRIAAGSFIALLVSSGLGLTAWNQKNQADLNLAESLGRESLFLFNEGKELDACVTAIKAGKILQNQGKTNREVLNALQTVLVEGSERNRLEGHDSYVNSVSISPDGKTLASGSGDNTIKLWNLETGEQIRTLKGHEETVTSVSFSPDGKTLASWSYDKTIKLWNLETGQEIRTLTGHDYYVNSVSFSPDGKIWASGSVDKTIKLWNLETGQEIRTLTGHDYYVNSVSFSPDGKTLASGSQDGTIKVWNLETGKEIRTLKGHDNSVNSVSFSPIPPSPVTKGGAGGILASGSNDGTIKLWNLESGQEIRTLQGHDYSVRSVSISPDGKTLASWSWDKTIKLWNLKTGKEIRTLTGYDSYVNSVSFSPIPPSPVTKGGAGRILASGSQDGTIKLWNLESGTEIRTLKGHDQTVWSVSFSLDGKTLASGSVDKTIKLWNLESGTEIRTLKGHDQTVWSVSFSPNGKTLASGSVDKTIKLSNLESGAEIRTLKGHDSSITSVSFSPDGKTLASGSMDKTIKLWNLETGKEIRTLKGHDDSVNSVSISPDGKTLASGSDDKTIKLSNLESGTEIRTLKGHDDAVNSVSFSPNGKTLASGSRDNTVKLWNLQSGAEIRTIRGHDDTVWSVSFSPDGKTLASGSWDGTIKLWNLERGEEILTLKGHDNSVWSVSFSPDGKTLASGSEDKTIKLWDLSLDLLLVANCNWVRNYLTHNPKVSESDRHLCDGIGG
ncbi:WD-40 repeat protein [Gloeothece citriformis PCC 7424]|uniref:WD-40 repeat protein n=1 Tax=Gloeothece citriformis (strain PCC 7424) TaxID=65393 RepID=B7K999_GLOC7|nr:hypothetical protein [Gloeothece citriformis]ACK68582.1 WD-40 repeat protein [Gloeothece citriformis PCC 7424]